MLNILIIEDEPLAANRLQDLLGQIEHDINVVQMCDSVEDSVVYLSSKPDLDLIFMDIQLADGLSFSIFEQTQIVAPVIFTTAYEEYAIRAFKVNSIDYLLKPIDIADLETAIDKFEQLYKKTPPSIDSSVLQSIQMMISEKEYKNRFTVKVGVHIRSIPTEEILYFYSFEKATYLCTSQSKNYPIDYTLDSLQTLISPKRYFRINRSHIISHDAISDIVSFSSSRLNVKLIHCDSTDIMVSRDKMKEFKMWLEG